VNVGTPDPPVTLPLIPNSSVVTLTGAVNATDLTISRVSALLTVQVIEIVRVDEFHSAKNNPPMLDPCVIHARLLPEEEVSSVISEGTVMCKVADVTPVAFLITIGGVTVEAPGVSVRLDGSNVTCGAAIITLGSTTISAAKKNTLRLNILIENVFPPVAVVQDEQPSTYYISASKASPDRLQIQLSLEASQKEAWSLLTPRQSRRDIARSSNHCARWIVATK
jgi:hypothetical protein